MGKIDDIVMTKKDMQMIRKGMYGGMQMAINTLECTIEDDSPIHKNKENVSYERFEYGKRRQITMISGILSGLVTIANDQLKQLNKLIDLETYEAITEAWREGAKFYESMEGECDEQRR
jgi:hypothetical protein